MEPQALKIPYTSATLGNALRNEVGKVREKFLANLDIHINPIEFLLNELVLKSDLEIFYIREGDINIAFNDSFKMEKPISNQSDNLSR